MAMSQSMKIDDVGLLTPPHSDMSSDSEAGSSPNSPVYDEMGMYHQCNHSHSWLLARS